ncbi:cupin domain-containing protein [Streptomyces sp. P1-3]|uniref:cupin domain-containing protein n=1 Tax=Streptomyces sp. P1-3 TaxID=3421658 RepID=UPI003D368186
MIIKFRIAEANASMESGVACQRLIPWAGQQEEPPLGAAACFLPPGGSSAPGCDDQDKVMVILDGVGSVDVSTEDETHTEPLSAGDVLVLPRHHKHVVHNRMNTPLTWISLHWPPHAPQPRKAD